MRVLNARHGAFMRYNSLYTRYPLEYIPFQTNMQLKRFEAPPRRAVDEKLRFSGALRA